MSRYVLEDSDSCVYNDGYYVGTTYIYQGEVFANADKNIENAKVYSSEKVATNACNEAYPKNCVECPRFNNCDSAYGEEGCGFKIFIEGNKELLAAKNKKKNKK